MSASSSQQVLRVSLRTGGSLSPSASVTALTLAFPLTVLPLLFIVNVSQVTVREVKDAISQRTSLPSTELCLVCQGRMLKDEAKTLEEYKVNYSAQIIAVRRSRSADQQPLRHDLSCSFGTITCLGSHVDVTHVI